MYLSSSESRSLFIETTVFLPLLMLPSLLTIISSGDGGSESYIIGDSAAAAGLLNDGFDAQLRGGPSSRAHGAVLLLPDYDFLTERSQLVLRKLDSMALGELSKSGLSLNELRAALDELREYGPAFEMQVKQALPSIRLLADLLGAMELSNAFSAESLSTSANYNNSNQNQTQHRYINRLEIQYKFLRSLYLTRRLEFLYKSTNNNNADNQDHDYQGGEDGSKVKTINTSAAIRALLALKAHKPLTNKLLAEALVEYIECLQKLNQIDGETNTLAVKNQEQLGLILSYLNSVEVRLLGKHVFSKLHLLSGQEELDQLKKTYRKELFKSGLIVENGELRIVGGLIEPANNCEHCPN